MLDFVGTQGIRGLAIRADLEGRAVVVRGRVARTVGGVT